MLGTLIDLFVFNLSKFVLFYQYLEVSFNDKCKLVAIYKFSFFFFQNFVLASGQELKGQRPGEKIELIKKKIKKIKRKKEKKLALTSYFSLRESFIRHRIVRSRVKSFSLALLSIYFLKERRLQEVPNSIFTEYGLYILYVPGGLQSADQAGLL